MPEAGEGGGRQGEEEEEAQSYSWVERTDPSGKDGQQQRIVYFKMARRKEFACFVGKMGRMFKVMNALITLIW